MADEEKSPRCLHQWNPHDGKPLSALFFLDNHKNPTPEWVSVFMEFIPICLCFWFHWWSLFLCVWGVCGGRWSCVLYPFIFAFCFLTFLCYFLFFYSMFLSFYLIFIVFLPWFMIFLRPLQRSEYFFLSFSSLLFSIFCSFFILSLS